MPAGSTFFSKNTPWPSSNAYLFRLPFGVSMITCKASVFVENGASRIGFARPPEFFFLGTDVGLPEPRDLCKRNHSPPEIPAFPYALRQKALGRSTSRRDDFGHGSSLAGCPAKNSFFLLTSSIFSVVPDFFVEMADDFRVYLFTVRH